MIDRNLKNVIPEKAFRTLEDMDKRMAAMAAEIATLRESANRNLAQIAKQSSDIAGLIGARSQAVIGQETPDPTLAQFGNGTVTSFSAGDLTPLFTTTEATTTTTPALAFAQIVKAKNLVFAGPATGADANPDFRTLDDADIPAKEVKTDDAFTKVIAGAPYANDGYVTLKDHAGNSVRVMTTA